MSERVLPRSPLPDDSCWNCGAPQVDSGSPICPGCGIGNVRGSIATEAPDSAQLAPRERGDQAAAAATTDPALDCAIKRVPWEPAPDAGPSATEPSHAQRELPEPTAAESVPTPEADAVPSANVSASRLFNSPLVLRTRPRQTTDSPPDDRGSRPHRVVDSGISPPFDGPPWAGPSEPTVNSTNGSRGGRPPSGPPPPGPNPPMTQALGTPGPSASSRATASAPAQPSATSTAASMAVPQTHVAPSAAAAMSVGKSDSLVGIITGPVSLDARYYRFWGWKLLLPLLIVAVILLVATAAGSAPAGISGLLSPVILMLVMFIIMAMAVGVSFKGAARALGKTTAGVAKQTLKAGSRGLVAGTKGAASMATRGSVSEQSLTIRRFRVQSPLGQTQACVMIGELQGDELRQGDLVRVYGREHRDGHRNTRKTEILQSVGGPVSSTVLAKRPASFTLTWVFDQLAKSASFVIVLLMLSALYGALK